MMAESKASSTKKGAGTSETETQGRGRRIEHVGEVVSNKMQKTISVQIFRTFRHEKYGKYMKRSSLLKAHDEKNEAKIGDVVRIKETRPLSKTKRFALVEIVQASSRQEGKGANK